MGGVMKRTILIALTALFMGCASTPVIETDVCERIRETTKTEITVLYDERDWETYFTEVGRKLSYNMSIGSSECVEVNILSAQHNQEIKGYYCMEKGADGWYTVETMCEYTQGEVTDRSIGFRKKLTPR
jgi:hypothetical protein